MPNFGYQQAPQASGKGASPFQNAYTPQYGGYEQPQTAQYQPPQPQAYEPPQPEQQYQPQQYQPPQPPEPQYQPQEQPQQQPEPPRNPALTVAQQAVEQQQAVAPGTNGAGIPPNGFPTTLQQMQEYTQQQNAARLRELELQQQEDSIRNRNQGLVQPPQLDPAMRAAQQARDQATAAFNRGEISPQQMLEATIKAGSAFGQNYSQDEQDQMLQNMTLGREQQQKYNDAMASGMTPQQWNEQQDRAAATAQGLSEEQFQEIQRRNAATAGQPLQSGNVPLDVLARYQQANQGNTLQGNTLQGLPQQYSPFSQQNMLSNIQNGAGVLGGSQQGLGQLGAINQGQANQLGQLGRFGGFNQQDAAMQAAIQAQADQLRQAQPYRPEEDTFIPQNPPSQQAPGERLSDMFKQFQQQRAQSATGKGVSGAPQTMGMDQSVYAKRGGAIGHYADGGDVVAPGMSLLMMEKK
jgi:hypothetical protein